jgi:23S rRNA pseudouridine2605 synthase
MADRINKFLASAGWGSRRACEALVREGRVSVNGKILRDLATLVAPGDEVRVDNRPVRVQKTATLALHKPKGYICSTTDPGERKTVYDLLPPDLPRLFYVGRLDYDSEGLLIMTNDGDLSQRLTHPSFKLPKTYEVTVDHDFDFALAARLKKGMMIEPGFARADAVFKLGEDKIKIVLGQGLKRQIRLMLLKLGYKVKKLKRVRIGSLELGRMKPGQWRMLSEGEIKALLQGGEKR